MLKYVEIMCVDVPVSSEDCTPGGGLIKSRNYQLGVDMQPQVRQRLP